jgi:hypothetical protein
MKNRVLVLALLVLVCTAAVRAADDNAETVKALLAILKDPNRTEAARTKAALVLVDLKAVELVPVEDLALLLKQVDPAREPKLASAILALTAERGPAARKFIPDLVLLKGRGDANFDAEVDRTLARLTAGGDPRGFELKLGQEQVTVRQGGKVEVKISRVGDADFLRRDLRFNAQLNGLGVKLQGLIARGQSAGLLVIEANDDARPGLHQINLNAPGMKPAALKVSIEEK